jgi:hypothetical protein
MCFSFDGVDGGQTGARQRVAQMDAIICKACGKLIGYRETPSNETTDSTIAFCAQCANITPDKLNKKPQEGQRGDAADAAES